jgi:hypothetical protein
VNADDTREEIYQNAHRDSMRLGTIPNPLNLPTSRFPALRRTTAAVIPDFLPPTSHAIHAILADGENDLWIGVAPRPGVIGTEYDVVSQRDGLIARVRVPEGRTLVGFAPGHIAFLSAPDGGRSVLERVSW